MDVRNRMMTEVRSDPIFSMREFEDYYTFMRRMELTFMRARELYDGARDIWLRRRETRTRFRQEMADRPEYPTVSRAIPRYTFHPYYTPRDRRDDPNPTFSDPPRESPVRGSEPSGVSGHSRSPSPEYTPGIDPDMVQDTDVDITGTESDGFEDIQRRRSTSYSPETGHTDSDPPEVEIRVDERSVVSRARSEDHSVEGHESSASPVEARVQGEHPVDDDSDIEMWEPEIPEPEIIYISSDSEPDEDPMEDPEEDPEEDFEPIDDTSADPDYVLGSQ